MGKFINLTGQKFGKLTVIERTKNRGKHTVWVCKGDPETDCYDCTQGGKAIQSDKILELFDIQECE